MAFKAQLQMSLPLYPSPVVHLLCDNGMRFAMSQDRDGYSPDSHLPGVPATTISLRAARGNASPRHAESWCGPLNSLINPNDE